MSQGTPSHYAQIQFKQNGTPLSAQFDDIYFSVEDGLAETRYVFLDKNKLNQRWGDLSHFHIAETGFGTGLNFFCTWQALKKLSSNLKLTYTSFEKYPLSKTDMVKALQFWPELNEFTEQFIQLYPEHIEQDVIISLDRGQIELRIIIGDVNERIGQIQLTTNNKVNAWYLDGFAPSKNPDMWTQLLFDNMARFADKNCTVATFTAAGFVRRGLISAGFNVTKYPGYGKKREMLAGQLTGTQTVANDES